MFATAVPAFEPRCASGDRLSVTWVGHSTLLLQAGPLNVLTDPHWSHRASPVSFAGPARWVPPAVPFESLPPVDLVLISHNHYDHLDAPTVRRLAVRAPDARWLAPLGLARWLRKRGVRNVSEHGWGQVVEHEGAEIACVPARHLSARTPFDRNRTWWCGWTIAAHDWRVYFAGDTGYHPDFRPIAERHGPFDLVMLPIGGYEPRWFMRSVHMNPDDTVRAYRELWTGPRPPVMVPMHWGTFKLADEPMDEPPRRFSHAWQLAGLPPGLLWLLRHGETRAVDRSVTGAVADARSADSRADPDPKP